MKGIYAAVAWIAILLGAPAAAQAQQPVVLANTSQQVLHSKINGVDYQLTVVLPPDYGKASGKRYPTLYVMDGNRWAQLLAVLLPRLVASADYPPIIVVGVDYPGASGRYQDYGPVSQRYFKVPQNRGAANYLRVMKEEIIPLVDNAYRTDPQSRGIGGHSMGGFFTAYAALHATDTFNRFWISSPSLFYDDEILFKDFEGFRKQRVAKPFYVFTDVGGDELPAMRNALERFSQKLVEAQPGKVVLDTLVVPGADHATVVPSVLAPALEHLYNYRPRIISAPADLLRFAGLYKLASGTVITLVTDGDGLFFRDSTVDYETGSLVRLLASAPSRFYQRGSAREFEFPKGPGVPGVVKVIDTGTGEVAEAARLASQEHQQTDVKVSTGLP